MDDLIPNWTRWKNDPDSIHFEEIMSFIHKIAQTDLLIDFVKMNRKSIVELKSWTNDSILHRLMKIRPSKELIQLFLSEMIELRNCAGNTPLHYLTLYFRKVPYSKEELEKEPGEREIPIEVLEMLTIFYTPIGDIQCPIKDVLNNGWKSIPPSCPFDYLDPELQERLERV